MKNFMLSIIVPIISFMLTSVAFAQNNMDNDSRYIRCPVGMGFISYIDTSSVAVNEYRPPQYIISINTIQRHEQDINGEHLRIHTLKFKYDYAQRKMYIYSPNHGDGLKNRYINEMKYQKKPVDKSIDWDSDWQYIAPDVYYGEGTGDMAVAGEVAFAIAYNLKFHGEKYARYQDGFYSKLPNATKIKNHL